MKKIRCWIGNLDGSREGLVIASNKEKARKAADLTRKFGSKDAWFEGRCRA